MFWNNIKEKQRREEGEVHTEHKQGQGGGFQREQLSTSKPDETLEPKPVMTLGCKPRNVS